MLVLISHCFITFSAASGSAANTDSLVAVGDALRQPATSELLAIAEELQEDRELADGIRNAAVVFAFSTGNQDQIALALTQLADASPLKSQSSLLKKLASTPLAVDPLAFTNDQLELVLEARSRLLEAAMIGKAERVEEQVLQITSDEQIPALVRERLLRLSESVRQLAEYVPPSPDKSALNASRAAQSADHEAVLAANASFIHFLESGPLERQLFASSRDDKKNTSVGRYDVLQTIEENRAEVIGAISKIKSEYWNGEIKRVVAIQKLQDAVSKSMDLKKKKALLYWSLKEMKADRQSASRSRRLKHNLDHQESIQQRTSADISPSWPGIFQHRQLRSLADNLRRELARYSSQNSGPLSLCYSKCCKHIMELDKLLKTDLTGITLSQRSTLRTYLREIEGELTEPYAEDCNLSCLAMHFNQQHKAEASPVIVKPSPRSSGDAIISLDLAGGHREWASYTLTQSLIRTMVAAGNGADRDALAEVAQEIRKSRLLTDEHRVALKTIGSRIYRGEIPTTDLRALVDPINALAQIAGLSNANQDSVQAPTSVQNEAFDLLIAPMIRKP